MTLASTPERPRSGGRKLWITAAIALIAVAVAVWAVLGGRGRPASEMRRGGGTLAVSGSTRGEAEAVDATPALDAADAGAFGGPGSAADGSGPVQIEAAGQGSPRPRVRRAPRRQAENRPADPPAPQYEAIGPAASEGEPPAPQT